MQQNVAALRKMLRPLAMTHQSRLVRLSHTAFSLLFAILMIGIWLATPAAGQAQGDILCVPQLLYGTTNNNNTIGGFSIDGDYIAFNARYPNSKQDSDIFLYQISTGTLERITEGQGQDIVGEDTGLSGDHLIFMRDGPASGDLELFLYQLSTGIFTRLTDQKFYGASFAVNGDYAIWQLIYPDLTIQYYQISTGETHSIDVPFAMYTTSLPSLRGDFITWAYFTDEADKTLDYAIYQISTGILRTLSPAYGTASWALPYGEYVLWREKGPGWDTTGDSSITLYHFPTETRLTLDEGYNTYPFIAGDYAAWGHSSSWDEETELVLYQLSTGTRTVLTDNEVPDYVYDMDPDWLLTGTGDKANDVNVYQISTGIMTTLMDSVIPWDTFRDSDYLGQIDEGNVIIELFWGRDTYLFTQAGTHCTPNLVTNGSFEDGLTGWTGKNLTGEKVTCKNLDGYNQPCGLKLKGSPDEHSKFTQTIDLTGSGLTAGIRLQVGGWFNSNMLPSGALKFKVTYADGQTATVKLKFADYGSGAFRMMLDELLLTGDPVELQVIIQHRTTIAKDMHVDQVFAVVKPFIYAEDRLPLPQDVIPLPGSQPESGLGVRH